MGGESEIEEFASFSPYRYRRSGQQSNPAALAYLELLNASGANGEAGFNPKVMALMAAKAGMKCPPAMPQVKRSGKVRVISRLYLAQKVDMFYGPFSRNG